MSISTPLTTQTVTFGKSFFYTNNLVFSFYNTFRKNLEVAYSLFQYNYWCTDRSDNVTTGDPVSRLEIKIYPVNDEIMCRVKLTFIMIHFQSVDFKLHQSQAYRRTVKFIGTNCM